MSSDEAKRLKQPEVENARLKKLVAEQAIDISILKEANDYLGELQAPRRGGARRRMCLCSASNRSVVSATCWASRGHPSGIERGQRIAMRSWPIACISWSSNTPGGGTGSRGARCG